MGQIDLDAGRAKRAAEREADHEPPTVVLNGETFTLPVEIPADMLRAEDPTAFPAIARALFGAQAEEVWSMLSVDDLLALFEGIQVEYGISPGESTASVAS